MLDWSASSAVKRDPERVSGAWVFRGTRVPVAALFENLGNGIGVDEFVRVTLDQAWSVFLRRGAC